MTLHPGTHPCCRRRQHTEEGRDFQPGLLAMVLLADRESQLHKDSTPGAGLWPCLSCLVQSHCATGQLCPGSTGTIHLVGTVLGTGPVLQSGAAGRGVFLPSVTQA